MKELVANRAYPFLHWLTSVVLGPIFILMGITFNTANYSSQVGDTLLLYIGFGALFSVPVLVIYFILFAVLASKSINAITIRAVLNIVTIAGVYLLQNAIDKELASESALAYCLAVVLSSFFYPVYKKKKPKEQESEPGAEPPADAAS